MSAVTIPIGKRTDRRFPSDGLAIVWLKPGVLSEYFGDPIVVRCYGHKLKSTQDGTRINPDEVENWCSITFQKIPEPSI